MGTFRYWLRVAGRARKEALSVSKLSNPAAVISTLAGLIVPPVILFVATNDASGWTRAAATAGGLGIGVLLIFSWHMVTVPAAMDSEAEAREDALKNTLASYDGPEEDADIREGLGWTVWREWGRTPAKDGGGRLPEVSDAAETLRKAVHRGKVTLWGRENPYSLHKKIDPAFFEKTSFDILTILTDGEEVRTEKDRTATPSRYHGLMINRAEFEREWPKT